VSVARADIRSERHRPMPACPLYLYIQHIRGRRSTMPPASVGGDALFENSGAPGAWPDPDLGSERGIRAEIDHLLSAGRIGRSARISTIRRLKIARTQQFSHYHTFTQEIQASGQIDRFHYTVGAFYLTTAATTRFRRNSSWASVRIKASSAFQRSLCRPTASSNTTRRSWRTG